MESRWIAFNRNRINHATLAHLLLGGAKQSRDKIVSFVLVFGAPRGCQYFFTSIRSTRSLISVSDVTSLTKCIKLNRVGDVTTSTDQHGASSSVTSPPSVNFWWIETAVYEIIVGHHGELVRTECPYILCSVLPPRWRSNEQIPEIFKVVITFDVLDETTVTLKSLQRQELFGGVAQLFRTDREPSQLVTSSMT